MNNREFARRLEERTKQFALQIIQLSAAPSRLLEALVIENQITKTGTSVGANYREANRSRSRADFKNRIKICESEASETQYWLELVSAAGWFIGKENRRRSEGMLRTARHFHFHR
jgi:four helix bundle protein